MKDSAQIQNEKVVNLYIKGILYSFGLAFILILILTTIFFFVDLNTNIINPLEFVILLLSIVYASIYISKRMSNKGWLHGIIVGVVYFAIILIINLVVAPIDFSILNILPKAIFFICTGFLGGCIGINIK
ncbi:MAG: TIGR04086 family membrane protein [Eubacteriaceae bacterium]